MRAPEMETVARSASSSSPTESAAKRADAPASVRPALLDDPRSKRILAKTIYRELRESGMHERDVLTIATELIGLVTDDLRQS